MDDIAWMERAYTRDMPPRVVCGRCRYFRCGIQTSFVRIPATCRHPAAVREVVTWYSVSRVRETPEAKNAHNDCPDYVAVTWREPVCAMLGLALIGGVVWLVIPWLSRLLF